MYQRLSRTLLGALFILNSAVHIVVDATITPENISPGIDTADPDHNSVNSNDEGKWNADMDFLTSYLEQLLRDGTLWDMYETPLLYVENTPTVVASEGSEEEETLSTPWKRSRYYRRYPWKRQNGRNRSQYADSSRYMCNPTREDVFQLLVALHEAREGNTRRTVNFCNRKRPASTIFTNIRFLGRRK